MLANFLLGRGCFVLPNQSVATDGPLRAPSTHGITLMKEICTVVFSASQCSALVLMSSVLAIFLLLFFMHVATVSR